METAIRTDVLVVGAGPTGLSLACHLARHGVDFLAVEKGEGVTPYSKAIGVQARTLEVYEQLGLARQAVEQGTIAGRGRMLIGGEVRAELDFSNIGAGLSPYPFVLLLEQSKNERLLYDYLRGRGKDVLWQTELESFSQDAEGVAARVRTADGASRLVEAKYLVGCDGPKSTVRHALGLAFGGSTFERIFYVADARIDWALGHDALHICFTKNSFVVFFPLKGEGRQRIVGVFPEELNKDEGDILYEEIEARIKDEAQLALDISDVEWFSTYKVHTRHASKFSAGRCFLAGDAAHVHTPAGGQGMNTGIQDAHNLAWKLALALGGGAGGRLLETYNEERLENAKRLLKTTDRIFGFAAGTDWLLAFLHANVLPPAAGFVLGLDAVRKFVFPLISQIGINYRHGSLSSHAGDEDFEVKAGDRMPYFRVGGESVFDRLRAPKFHLLIFSNEEAAVQALQAELEKEHAELIDFNAVPLSAQVSEIFGADSPFTVLLRPDNHVAFIHAGASVGRVGAYLNEFVRR